MTRRDYYQVLGVPRGAAPDDIRSAYVRLARRHHPDTDGSLPERLREVQQAYRCLSDAGARARHDHSILEEERRHLAHARRVRRSLRRYDRRHPHLAPRPYYRPGWRAVVVVAAGLALVAGLSATLIG